MFAEVVDVREVPHEGSTPSTERHSDALDWLWHNVTRPVLEQLGYVRAPQGDRWPRTPWHETIAEESG